MSLRGAHDRGAHGAAGGRGGAGEHDGAGAYSGVGERGDGLAAGPHDGSRGGSRGGAGSCHAGRGGRARRGSWLMAAGAILIAAALCLAAFNLYSEQRAGSASNGALDELRAQMPLSDALPSSALGPDSAMPVAYVDGIAYVGTLTLPTLGLELPVVSEWNYDRLQVAPCRYTGTPYAHNFVIAAHNYSTHFGRIKDLQYGDLVVFEDVDGNTFAYRVQMVDILEPGAVEEMTSGEYDLTLFTCTLGGASRVTVRCNE